MLQLRFTPWLRAGGALAVFTLVFLVTPASIVSKDPFRPLRDAPPIAEALPVVQSWLRFLDAGQFEMAYDTTDMGFRSRYTKADFLHLSATVRQPLGTTIARAEYGQQAAPQYVDRGYVRAYAFLTTFENTPAPVQEVVWLFGAEGARQWQVAGYNVFPQTTAIPSLPGRLSQRPASGPTVGQ